MSEIEPGEATFAIWKWAFVPPPKLGLYLSAFLALAASLRELVRSAPAWDGREDHAPGRVPRDGRCRPGGGEGVTVWTAHLFAYAALAIVVLLLGWE